MSNRKREDEEMEKKLVPSGDSAAPIVRRPNLLDGALEKLSESQRAELEESVAKEQLNLDVSVKKAEARFVASTKDMARDARMAQQLDSSTKTDFKISSKYETASGNTNVEIRRSTNFNIMITAIVIGLVVLFILMSSFE